MSSDVVIRAEGLGKKYLIGHQAERERYVALRDVIARNVRNLARGVRDMIRGRPIIAGDEVEEFWALKDVNFEIRRGEVVGIIGRNGAGKSTLLKILARITEPSAGRVEIRGRVASLLEVGTGFHPELTGRENIYLNGAILGMTRAEIKRKFDEIVDFAGVEKFLDTPVKRYSSGMYVRLAFAVAAHLDPEILLVDEVLAVGDAEFQKKCLGKMDDVAKSGRTVLFVSHNMGMIQSLCQKGILFANGRPKFFGKVDEAIKAYISDSSSTPPNPRNKKSSVYINSISIYNADKNIPIVRTFDDIIISVRFSSLEDIKNGSVVLAIYDHTKNKISLLSTRPDSNFPLDIRRGENEIKCIIRSNPFAAGTYIIGGGIAIPNEKWLFFDDHITEMHISENDVFSSGLPPNSKRYIIALQHEWVHTP